MVGGAIRLSNGLRWIWVQRDEYQTAHFAAVIARLDPKSGLPDFGTYQNDRNRKHPISIGDPVNTDRGYWIARSSRAMTLIGSAQQKHALAHTDAAGDCPRQPRANLIRAASNLFSARSNRYPSSDLISARSAGAISSRASA